MTTDGIMVECPQGCTTLTEGICIVHPGLQGDMADLLGVLVEYPRQTVELAA